MSRLLESSCPLLTFHSLSPAHPALMKNPIKATFAAINIISMDCKDMEENGTKTRSLRFEDYYNRRVFLRSYPLHFGAGDEKTKQEKVSATIKDTEKKPIRRMFLAVIHWGEGKVLILRKFKHKLQVMKTRRSLPFEDHNNRRVFLRSYPLPFGAEDEKTNEENVCAANKDTERKPIRRMFLAVIHWGEGSVLILRKFMHKLQVYIIACMPISFKPPTALISI